MRLILIGQAAFAEQVLDRLRDKGHEIAAVYCPPDGTGKPDPVKVRAQALGIPVHQHASLKKPEVQQEFVDLNADLAVLAYVTQIVPQAVFEVPRLGSICFHPSLLPKYRGGSAIPWQIIKGETETGVSVFWVDPGIDTGPLLVQKTATIGPEDNAATLYFNKLFPIGVDAVVESVELIAHSKAPRLVQDESKATYDPLCRDEHAAIDWSCPVEDVYNRIRGCDPNPGAFTTINGAKVRLFDAKLVEGRFRVGVIEDISADGLLIGATGGAVRIKRVRGEGAKLSALDFSAQTGLGAGTKLG